MTIPTQKTLTSKSTTHLKNRSVAYLARANRHPPNTNYLDIKESDFQVDFISFHSSQFHREKKFIDDDDDYLFWLKFE